MNYKNAATIANLKIMEDTRKKLDHIDIQAVQKRQ